MRGKIPAGKNPQNFRFWNFGFSMGGAPIKVIITGYSWILYFDQFGFPIALKNLANFNFGTHIIFIGHIIFFESNHWKDAKFWGAGCSPIWSSFRIYQVFYCLILFQFVRFTKFIEIRFLKSTLRKFQTSAKLQFDWHIYNFDVFEDLEWKENDKNIGSHNVIVFNEVCLLALLIWSEKCSRESVFRRKNRNFWAKLMVF